MKIAIVGGGLQGVEVAYLSKKAGYTAVVLDKSPDPPAKGLADEFVQVDICRIDQASDILERADLVLPALENDMALAALEQWHNGSATPICFDFDAYRISSSKLRSNQLFSTLAVPKPMDWPQCGFPVVVKPSVGSGSHGVRIIRSQEEWEKNFDAPHPKDPSEKEFWVVEEYITGPSYSLELIGSRGRYETLPLTELFMDEDYDCKRIIAPVEIDAHLIRRFESSAKTVARHMKLDGIMDFEVILHKKEMKMLEIDARFPSQTPMAVYAATGVNMVKLLADLTLGRPWDVVFPAGAPAAGHPNKPRPAMVEHIFVNSRGIGVKGENMMRSCGPLHLETDFFGADEAVTSYVPGCDKWVATLIIKAATHAETRQKHEGILSGLARTFNLPLLPDNHEI